MNIDLPGFLRSLSFGGLIGGGLVACLYILFPQLFVGHLSFELMFILGSLLGAAAHRGIDTIILKGLLYPFGRFITYYGKLAQLGWLSRRGIIDDESYLKIRRELTLQYFLNEKGNNDSKKFLGS